MRVPWLSIFEESWKKLNISKTLVNQHKFFSKPFLCFELDAKAMEQESLWINHLFLPLWQMFIFGGITDSPFQLFCSNSQLLHYLGVIPRQGQIQIGFSLDDFVSNLLYPLICCSSRLNPWILFTLSQRALELGFMTKLNIFWWKFLLRQS